ncbi:unnamed protein product, partial [Prorocentrum cordatum]
ERPGHASARAAANHLGGRSRRGRRLALGLPGAPAGRRGAGGRGGARGDQGGQEGCRQEGCRAAARGERAQRGRPGARVHARRGRAGTPRLARLGPALELGG